MDDVVPELEQTSAYRHRHSHDDGLADTNHVIAAAMDSCVEQVVRRLLKRGCVQDAVFHLGNAESCDTQHFTWTCV